MFCGFYEFPSLESISILAYMLDHSHVEILVSLFAGWSIKDIGVRKYWAKELLDTRPPHQFLCNESLHQVATICEHEEQWTRKVRRTSGLLGGVCLTLGLGTIY